MKRTLLLALSAMLLTAMHSDAVHASTIDSAKSEVQAAHEPIDFQFSATGVELLTNPQPVGVELLWKATAGTGEGGALTAGLAIPDFELGDKIESALDIVLPSEGEAPVVTSTELSDDQIEVVKNALATDEVGVMQALLFSSGADLAALDEFLEGGGSLEATFSLTSALDVSTPSGPSGNGNVPEPLSAAVWVVAVTSCLLHRRLRSSREPSNVQSS
jgi:hypothetical protein